MKDKIRERFEKYYIPEPNSGCWLWVGAHSRKSGYGTFRIVLDNKIVARASHRASAYLYHKTYNPDLCVLHKCDNPACVNPDHLFQGTMKDNADDRERKGRGVHTMCPRGENNHEAKLSNAEAKKIKIMFKKGKSIPKVCLSFPQVTRPTIEAIKYGRTWKSIQI